MFCRNPNFVNYKKYIIKNFLPIFFFGIVILSTIFFIVIICVLYKKLKKSKEM